MNDKESLSQFRMLAGIFHDAAQNAWEMFKESGDMYHEGRRVAYEQAKAYVDEASDQFLRRNEEEI